MKKAIIYLLISVCICKCSEKKETIQFVTLKENEFNNNSFKLPDSSTVDSAKRAHDNCMGFSFEANALLITKKDTLFIGTIINKRSFKILNTLKDLGLTIDQIVSQFNSVANPCYEQRIFNSPIKSIFGENFSLQLPGSNKEMNKEINDAISASKDVNIKTGSWVYLDMTTALTRILDTAKSPVYLEYKKNLLDTSNMILTAVESIQNVILTVNTDKGISERLTALLKTKPVLQSNSKFSVQLFYINSNTFEVFIEGFFPVIGQFTKAQFE